MHMNYRAVSLRCDTWESVPDGVRSSTKGSKMLRCGRETGFIINQLFYSVLTFFPDIQLHDYFLCSALCSHALISSCDFGLFFSIANFFHNHDSMEFH